MRDHRYIIALLAGYGILAALHHLVSPFWAITIGLAGAAAIVWWISRK